jgi:hypothetical protein
MAEPPDLDTLARRYLDLWQEQVAAVAADPELTQTYAHLAQAMSALGPAGWMSLWSAAAPGFQPPNPGSPPPHDQRAAQAAAPSAPPRAAAAAAPPGDRRDDLAELGRRFAALEERLFRIESSLGPVPGLGAGAPAAGASAGRRVRRSGS